MYFRVFSIPLIISLLLSGFTPAAAQPSVQITQSQANSYAIVDTGQTKCYNAGLEIACPVSGASFYGQDAQYVGNSPCYTLSANGVTVYDNVTGLTWEHSPDTTGDSLLTAADKLTYTGALAHCAAHSSAVYQGYNDWRLPSIKELYSLINFNGTDPSGYSGTDTSGLTPFINTAYFDFAYGNASAGERIIDSQYASSTVYVLNPSDSDSTKLFGVNFADGRIKGYDLTMPDGLTQKTFFVQCVRGNTAYGINVFVDNGDQTITDNGTSLMWAKSDSGTPMNWQDALAWVQAKNAQNYLGHSDWRLPNAKELHSILDYTRSPATTNSAAIASIFKATSFTNEAGQTEWPWYWSSTTHAAYNGMAASGIYFAFGRAGGWQKASISATCYTLYDVHGAGAQRSDPKTSVGLVTMGTACTGGTAYGLGPQGDVQRAANYVRVVRDVSTGTFQDVPITHWAYQWIENLVASGVTTGCSLVPRLFCPGEPVTRAQMAVFLLRSEHGSAYTPPAASGVFLDVPVDYWAAAWIEQLALEGITSGCSAAPKLYCPEAVVSRDQMAVFLLRGLYGSLYTPPSPTGVFEDVPTSYWAAAWIEQLALEGITSGCSAAPMLYCPGGAVLREQMAVFLGRAASVPKFGMTQTLSDGAQRNTIAFDGLTFITGNLESDSFFPPGKVADFWGFQYLRDNDPSEMGHNTDFLTRASLNMLYVLTSAQRAELIALAQAQVGDINQYAYNRFVLMKAFRRQLVGDLPTGTTGLDKTAVMAYSASLYRLDGEISYARAQVMGGLINELDASQRAYLNAMVGKGMLTWPVVSEPDELRGLGHDVKVAVMTYAGDMFSWYAGSLQADVYFCPERQGTYFGSFYMKDAPAVGNPNYTIPSNLTAEKGEAFLKVLTADQAVLVTDLVDAQKPALYEIVDRRTDVSALLRQFMSGGTPDKASVLSLMERYGELDGDIITRYALAFSQVSQSLSAEQRAQLIMIRTDLLGDLSYPASAYLYATGIPLPTIPDTDFLFSAGG